MAYSGRLSSMFQTGTSNPLNIPQNLGSFVNPQVAPEYQNLVDQQGNRSQGAARGINRGPAAPSPLANNLQELLGQMFFGDQNAATPAAPAAPTIDPNAVLAGSQNRVDRQAGQGYRPTTKAEMNGLMSPLGSPQPLTTVPQFESPYNQVQSQSQATNQNPNQVISQPNSPTSSQTPPQTIQSAMQTPSPLRPVGTPTQDSSPLARSLGWRVPGSTKTADEYAADTLGGSTTDPGFDYSRGGMDRIMAEHVLNLRSTSQQQPGFYGRFASRGQDRSNRMTPESLAQIRATTPQVWMSRG